MLKALPSPTHMGLVELEKKKLLKFLISQNIDGLHRRSGFPSDKLAELHGNTNLEKCKKCGKKYLRDFRARTAMQVHDHATGRFCDDKKCNGELFDSIINFGENLPEQDMNLGFAHSAEADLCLVMGSSLRVSPACDMAVDVGRRKKNLVIVNLQKTPYDSLCSLRIFALCDDVVERLMKKLNMEIPKYILKRYFRLRKLKKGLAIEGIDAD